MITVTAIIVGSIPTLVKRQSAALSSTTQHAMLLELAVAAMCEIQCEAKRNISLLWYIKDGVEFGHSTSVLAEIGQYMGTEQMNGVS